jgi:hypothetical protein
MGFVAARTRFDLDQAGQANLGEELIAGTTTSTTVRTLWQ